MSTVISKSAMVASVVGMVATFEHGFAGQTAEIDLIDRNGISISFPGIDESDGITECSLPPDPTIAAGDDFVVQVVNKVIKVFNRDGTVYSVGSVDQVDDLADVLENMFDPDVMFDPFADRFAVSGVSGVVGIGSSGADTDPDFPELADWTFVENTQSYQNISCGGNSTGGSAGADQTSIGFDDTAWYAATFGAGTGTALGGFYVIAKPSAAGTPGTPTRILSKDFPGSPCLATSLGTEIPRAVEHYDQPEHTVDSVADTPTPYFVSVVRSDTTGGETCDAGKHDTLRIWSIGDPLSASRSLHVVDIAAPECFDAAEQYDLTANGNSTAFRAGDARLSNAVYRQDGSDEYLYTAHSVKKDLAGGGYRIVVRWYKVDLNGWPGDGASDPVVDAWGEIDGRTVGGTQSHFFWPAIAVNDDHDICVVMHQVSDVQNVSIQAWGRTAAGTETPRQTIKSSTSSTTPGNQNEWGDYTDIVVDPDGESFWLTGEWATSATSTPCSSVEWSTWIAQVKILVLP